LKIIIYDCKFKNNNPEYIKEKIRKAICHLGTFKMSHITDEQEDDWNWEEGTYNFGER